MKEDAGVRSHHIASVSQFNPSYNSNSPTPTSPKPSNMNMASIPPRMFPSHSPPPGALLAHPPLWP
ncbi:hypothetical protein LY78DRAFT_683831 [Colletotrichum sublineola]|nr:hypothetical protein LY78DRAFT_683831 [Colletotrichum sublineola]